jgi:ornithine cyclodeaminase/alanine dehydrogenase-like protein (mu-crystallin family)
MPLLLRHAEIEPLLDMEQAMAITEQVYREQAEGGVIGHPPQMMHVAEGNALRVVAGGLARRGQVGLRAGMLYGSHVALLWSIDSGELLAIMGSYFGQLRTGAAMGVATKHLAPAEVRSVGLLGSGRNALSLLRGARAARPGIQRVRVCSPTAEHREAFAARAQADLGVPVEAVAEPQAAVDGAEVVLVATNALQPALLAEWLAPGAFVGAMGRPAELHPRVYRGADRIMVGHKQQERQGARYAHPLLELVKAGELDWDTDVTELSDVVAGKAPGRSSVGELVVFKESQGGYTDTAMAAWAYGRARELGIGQHWSLD